jgi:hypothetical protein
MQLRTQAAVVQTAEPRTRSSSSAGKFLQANLAAWAWVEWGKIDPPQIAGVGRHRLRGLCTAVRMTVHQTLKKQILRRNST